LSLALRYKECRQLPPHAAPVYTAACINDCDTGKNMSTITEDVIRRIKPPCKPWLPCGDNLYLRCHVTTKGELSRRWFYRSEKSGFRSLGAAWPRMSLREARAQVGQIKHAGRAVNTVDLVRDLADDFYATTIAGKRKDAKLVLGYLNREIDPAIGGKKVRDVAPEDVMSVLKPIVKRGSPIAANRCFDVLRLLFDFGMAHGKLTTNPCAPIKKRHIGGIEKPRARALSSDEIKALLGMVESKAEAPIYRLLLLTGLRLNELLQIERGMIHDDVLTLPASLMKARREHKVYLAPTMLAEINRQIGKHQSPFVFPAESDAKKPFPKTTLQQRWMLFRPDGVTLRDLRRTMRTGCGELGIRPDICEMMLAHKLPGIQATYDRYDYAKELREAWRMWADRIALLRSAALAEAK
jgi:integrase